MYKIVILLFFVFVVSCNEKKCLNENVTAYHIIIENRNIFKTPNSAQFIDTVEYIPLETNKECLIGKMDKVKYCKDNFLILDKMAKTVFLYDRSGKFISKYNKIGKGPFEYLEINDIDVDSSGNCYLIDTRKIIKLDSNLQAIEEIKLPFGTCNFAICNNEIAVQHLGKKDKVFILSDKGKMLSSYLSDNGKPRYSAMKPFVKYKDELLYLPPNSDTIYTVNSDSISIHTIVEFEKPTPKDFFNSLNSKKQSLFSGFVPDIYMHGVSDYCETEEYIAFNFSYEYKNYNGPFYVLYSKDSNKTIVYTNKIENNCYLSKYPPFIYDVTPEGSFIAVIDAGLFSAAVEEKRNTILINEKLKEVTELSNPVIALIKFKHPKP